FFFFMSTRSLISTLFPYTTLFRSRTFDRRWQLSRHHARQRILLFDFSQINHAHGLLPFEIVCELVQVFQDRDKRKLFADIRESLDRKSTRLNSSHGSISYAVFCLK